MNKNRTKVGAVSMAHLGTRKPVTTFASTVSSIVPCPTAAISVKSEQITRKELYLN